jgi:hypothetical protein
LHNCGVGKQRDKLSFTSSYDTTNHVVTNPSDLTSGNIKVDIVRLDEVLENRIPILIKIDTEGFEMAVLEGAISTLRRAATMAIIVEINGSCNRYGVKEKDIHEFIIALGYIPISYSPYDRSFLIRNSFNPHANTIYIKNETAIRERLRSSRKFNVLKQAI